MRLLLDTCAFLWLDGNPDRLPVKVRQAYQSSQNSVYLSVASAWEISIKSKLRQLTLPDQADRYVADCIAAYGLLVVDIGLEHALHAGNLDLHHKDPFDRMLIAQAEVEGLIIATPDPAFAPYGVPLLW